MPHIGRIKQKHMYWENHSCLGWCHNEPPVQRYFFFVAKCLSWNFRSGLLQFRLFFAVLLTKHLKRGRFSQSPEELLMNLESGSILFNHSIQHVPSSFPTRANQRSITLLLQEESARGVRSILLCVQNFECCSIVTCFLFRSERDTHLFGLESL